ncbi:serine/threonine protein kinase [Streptomyces litchfieldiae]|uniref:Serine/threonine protein kinase n=1 Tax=Streptomyces litchfieldiae TaxID=3075543 RepID=A0ABU2MXQ4_9ACTN|nr:serine/threonine protein kinase [Streptomyces sp. DSM 44938]MDT0346152.1 serine/threonine protein kinase [Streptomyces sp. DSM 44938]
MDSFAGRLLADRYRLPRTPSEEFELIESRAFDTASGQEVLVRQVPLPEIVDAETLDDDGRRARPPARGMADRATRTPDDPVVRRAVEAAVAAARLPDHPRLDQVFDVFVQGNGLWIVSELVPARPLAAVLAEERLGPFRAAEVAADLLAALRIVHAHGWTHRNVTARTVMICEDGRAVLTGLAAGAAEEVLCGYDPLPSDVPETFAAHPGQRAPAEQPSPSPARIPAQPQHQTQPPPQHQQLPHPPHGESGAPGHADLAARVRRQGGLPPGYEEQPYGPEAYRRWDTGSVPRVDPDPGTPPPGGAAGLVARVRQQGGHPVEPAAQHGSGAREKLPSSWDFEGGNGAPPGEGTPPGAVDRAARSGAIAAYRAGTQAGAARRPGSGNGPQGGASPTELPGAGRPSHPVRTGWEPVPRQAPPPAEQGPPTQQLPQARQAPQPPRTQQAPQERAAVPPGEDRYRGPDSALAAERARQARIMTVGAVTERWAPEQAGPVYEHWRLAPPVGPPADFWALGALLFRAVQGYPPYPEESAAELTQAVCAEQPAFAEDCGALRPIIESLLRQDPTERLSAEELRGWLRSLLRSAPEPEVGRRTVTAPPALEPGRPADPRRLPIVRRRGELVGPRRRPRQRRPRSPRRLGRALLTLVLLGMAGAVAYVLAFMSEEENPDQGAPPPESQEPVGESPAPPEDDEPTDEPTEGSTQPSPAGQDDQPAPPPDGFTVQEDAAGFALTVPEGWQRQAENDQGQIVYADGSAEIVVVPGRDSAAEFASEPMDYQLGQQRELDAYRDYQYRVASGLFEKRLGDVSWAEGIFEWRDDDGEWVAYNRVWLIDGAYHIVMATGPAAERDRLGEIYDVTAESYEPAGG